MTEVVRWWTALAGIAWWCMFPFAFWFGTGARWEHRCAGRTFTGTFDDCFSDGLPVLELLAPVLTLMFVYPFARFAFSMFGPDRDRRTLRWRWAATSGGAAYVPAFQILAIIGVIWAFLHLCSLPFSLKYRYLLAYWVLWMGWFSLGAYASSPLAMRDSSRGQ